MWLSSCERQGTPSFRTQGRPVNSEGSEDHRLMGFTEEITCLTQPALRWGFQLSRVGQLWLLCRDDICLPWSYPLVLIVASRERENSFATRQAALWKLGDDNSFHPESSFHLHAVPPPPQAFLADPQTITSRSTAILAPLWYRQTKMESILREGFSNSQSSSSMDLVVSLKLFIVGI